MYAKICCRLSTFIEHHLQLNLGFRPENFVFAGEGFILNSGFRNILCSQEMDLVLILVSQKLCEFYWVTLVTGVLFGCYMDVAGMLQGCYLGVTGMLQRS